MSASPSRSPSHSPGHSSVLEEYTTALEAAPALLAAARAVAEGTRASAVALVQMSERLVPAGGIVTDGDRAEELLKIASQCAEQGTTIENVAMSCEHLVEEIAETIHTINSDLEEAQSNQDCTALALRLLASAAQRGRDAAVEATEVTADTARVAVHALAVVRGATHSQTDGRAPPQRSQRPRPPSARRRGTSQSADGGTPPRSPWTQCGKAEGDAFPRSANAAPQSEHSARPGSSNASPPPCGDPQRRGRSGSAQRTPRSGSVGARARTDALVQRRVKLFDEMVKSNAEVLSLQRELLMELARCPPLLPAASAAQRRRVFGVVGEILREAIADLRHAAAGASLGAPLGAPFGATATLRDLLPWLPRDGSSGNVAIFDVRAGVLRLAALLDIETLASVLRDEFLPLLLAARPSAEEESLRKMVAHSVECLRAWVSAKP